MNFVKSNRVLRIALLAALGSVAWSPMAGALQKASHAGDANSGTFPKQFAAGAPTLAAKGFSVIYEFPQNVQNYPLGDVVVDRLGNLFGATFHGGPDVYGDVYELTPSGTFTDIHDFTVAAGDGKYPATGSPYLDASGNLFLTATAGGAGNAGTAIKLSPSGGSYAETALFSFDTTDGGYPNASLMRRGPTLYTTTYMGGANGLGAIVALSPSNLSEKLLYSFSGLHSDGQNPATNLVADAHGSLYGTTFQGGSGGIGNFGSGTVFKFVPTKSGGKETVLWNFGVVTNDGVAPFAPPIVDSAGNIYGTTQYGGGLTHGVVWKLTPSGGSYVETVLHSFGVPGGNNDGCYPMGGLKLVGTTLYGTTTGCGTNGDNGTIFSISTTGTNYAILHSFNDNDGKSPEFASWSVKGKTLYGTTAQGGIGGTGVVWRYVL